MADKTGIEWTRGDDGSAGATWNPIVGCEAVSPGCDHCYAAREASGRLRHLPQYADLATGGKFTGEVRLLPERLDQPLKWKRPRRIFVNSMSDLFHKDVPDDFIARVFAVMAAAPQHTFQVLTKRHARMKALLNSDKLVGAVGRHWSANDSVPATEFWPGWPLPNVWCGVSVETQQWANLRIPALLETPAAVRFLSCEPLLGRVDLRHHLTGHCPEHDFPGGFCVQRDHPGVQHIGWVIAGGESGPKARPMHPAWVRAIRDHCQAAGVPFLFKQWGEWAPVADADDWRNRRESDWLIRSNGYAYPMAEPQEAPGDPASEVVMRRVGKKAAGRELDGRTWDEYPQTPAPSP